VHQVYFIYKISNQFKRNGVGGHGLLFCDIISWLQPKEIKSLILEQLRN